MSHCNLSSFRIAQGRLGRKTTMSVLNPKALSVAELYGTLDKDTRDWTDGLLSSLFRCGCDWYMLGVVWGRSSTLPAACTTRLISCNPQAHVLGSVCKGGSTLLAASCRRNGVNAVTAKRIPQPTSPDPSQGAEQAAAAGS